jgi:hypothetical protein
MKEIIVDGIILRIYNKQPHVFINVSIESMNNLEIINGIHPNSDV